MQGGDSGGMSETDEISQRRVAAVIAHRSPHRTRPPETQISSTIHSFTQKHSVHSKILYTLIFQKRLSYKGKPFFMGNIIRIDQWMLIIDRLSHKIDR